MLTAFSVLWGGLAGLYSVLRGLGAMWCAGGASGVDGERPGGRSYGVYEGGPISAVSRVWCDLMVI